MCDVFVGGRTPRYFDRRVGPWRLCCCVVIGCLCVVWVWRYWSVQMTVWWLIARLEEKGDLWGEILPRIFCGIMPLTERCLKDAFLLGV